MSANFALCDGRAYILLDVGALSAALSFFYCTYATI